MFIETCAGGGGRFDLGMLYYGPQIWASDNTEPCERAHIQYSLSYAYNPSAASGHVTRNNSFAGVDRSMDFRYLVSSVGSYGYELDITQLSQEEEELIKGFNDRHRAIKDIVAKGDLYRIISPIDDNTWFAYMQVAKDKSKAVFTFLQLNPRHIAESCIVRMKGLNPDYQYSINGSQVDYNGAYLMNAGIRLNDLICPHGIVDTDGSFGFSKGGSGSGLQLVLTRSK